MFAIPRHSPAGPPVAVPVPFSDKSIAVLPFTDMSEKHDQEYFADGMAEEILNLLVKIPELRVIGRISSFSFKGKAADLRDIGAALGSAYVVEGSVRRSGDHVRVTAQLIDARDGTHRWSETYDRDFIDVLKVEGEIAASLARALQLEVTESMRIRAQTSLRSSEVYNIYLQGIRAMNRIDLPGFEEAVADFRQALTLDPSFVPAAEGLALSLRGLVDWGLVPSRPGWEQARAAALAALKLDPNSADAHAVLGRVYSDFDWNWPAAQHELTTALALAPNSPLILYLTAAERLSLGQWAEALRFVNAASAADPLDPTVHLVAGWVYLRLGRLAEAERANRRVLEIAPTFVTDHYYLGVVLLMEGKTEESLAEMQKETRAGGQVAGLAVVYQALHRRREADAALARLEAESAEDMAMEIAEAYAFRGQKDRAFEWLDRAYAQKDENLFYIKGDPLLKNLSGDPRYSNFLRKMNVPD
jgi:TolB-like protein